MAPEQVTQFVLQHSYSSAARVKSSGRKSLVIFGRNWRSRLHIGLSTCSNHVIGKTGSDKTATITMSCGNQQPRRVELGLWLHMLAIRSLQLITNHYVMHGTMELKYETLNKCLQELRCQRYICCSILLCVLSLNSGTFSNHSTLPMTCHLFSTKASVIVSVQRRLFSTSTSTTTTGLIFQMFHRCSRVS
ncbi:hypothetical protein PsorP6_015159 [Peronosclerospora sorghi]|uniref:Uncharacterized protein n=1 Tax=Peronosclerospora sorghi TaxID=230839 RepID=A0ACC0VTC8_9STRA|nr:hypothetical protein PsorP6_015159 [Peronosclerospora sorghi]